MMAPVRPFSIFAAALCVAACSAPQKAEVAAEPAAGNASPQAAAEATPAPPPAHHKAPEAAPAKAPPPAAAPLDDQMPPAHMPTKIGDISDFPYGTPDGLLRNALHCALDIAADGEAFDCYAALNVSTNRDTDIALAHLRNYQWKVFRQRAANYVVAEKPFTVRVTRRDPDSGDGKEVKLFLYGKGRDFPAPITLRRDGSRWQIYTNSL